MTKSSKQRALEELCKLEMRFTEAMERFANMAPPERTPLAVLREAITYLQNAAGLIEAAARAERGQPV